MEWYGKLPEGWEVVRIKTICSEITKLTDKDDGNLLSVSQYTGVTEKKENIRKIGMHEAESLIGYKIVKKNDLVMNIMLAWNGSMGISKYNGIVSPAYSVFDFRENVNPWYFHYLFRTPEMTNYFKAYSTGVVESRLRLYPNIFVSLYTPLPPLPVQTEIVRYLDGKVSQINKLIESKRQEISLLQEYKRGIIDEELKGDWKKIPLKRILEESLQYGANDSGVPFQTDLPRYIRITDIALDGTLKTDDSKSLTKDVATPYMLQEGDILLARSGATAGKSFLYKEKYGSCAFAGYLIKANVRKDVLFPRYFIYFTNSSYYMDWKNSIFIQATIPNISAEKYNYLPIKLPPISEQRNIVERLDTRCGKIDRLIAGIERQVELLGEYKARLVSDTVTGKVAIQDIAAQESKEVSQQVKIIEFMPKHSKGYEDAVILTALVNSFGTNEHPFTAFDCQKFPYLLHRHLEGVAENYGKFAAGPYNPTLKYKTARPIALAKKYIREQTGLYKGFVADVNATEAVKYFLEWYSNEPLAWMQQFRYIPNRKNELELLTTVDMAIVELHGKRLLVTMQTVKDVIKQSKAWKDKLTRAIFSDENIERAIEWSYKHFGNN